MAFNPEEYSDVHRLFLQACANHGTIDIPMAIQILDPIIQKYGEATESCETNKKLLNEVVNAMNIKISQFDQKITLLKYDVTGEEFLVYEYTSEISMNKFQTIYTDQEVQYFCVLIKDIVKTDNFHITQMRCVNLTAAIPKLKERTKLVTKERAEELLEEWTRGGYFYQANREVYFGPRMLGEFGGYLNTNFPKNVTTCKLCRHVVFAGVRCENCSTLLHSDCMKKCLAKLNKCPACKKVWTTPMEMD